MEIKNTLFHCLIPSSTFLPVLEATGKAALIVELLLSEPK